LTVVDFSVAAADAPPVAARSVEKETRRQKKGAARKGLRASWRLWATEVSTASTRVATRRRLPVPGRPRAEFRFLNFQK
jgi:hypothetical protein